MSSNSLDDQMTAEDTVGHVYIGYTLQVTASFLVICCHNYVNTNFSAPLAVRQALKKPLLGHNGRNKKCVLGPEIGQFDAFLQ
jgi:hypothetical protein